MGSNHLPTAARVIHRPYVCGLLRVGASLNQDSKMEIRRGSKQGLLEELVRKWGLELEASPIETRSGVIAFAGRGAEKVALKLPDRRSDEAAAGAALKHFDGRGAIRVLEHDPSGGLLLERAQPGHALTKLVLEGADDRATVVLCEVVRALHRREPPDSGFRVVEDLGRGLERYRRMGQAAIPVGLLDRASGLFADLAASQAARRLLHGDLHHDNILFDANRGWLAIDPKGVLGEPAYEIGAALRNPTEDPTWFATPSIVDRRVRIVSDCLGLDRQRVLSWAFAQAVLSAVWSLEDRLDPSRGLLTAEAILTML
jgi:streptomycin 6-kinase